MKRIVLTLTLLVLFSISALAGIIETPGGYCGQETCPPPPCTENCPPVQYDEAGLQELFTQSLTSLILGGVSSVV